MSAYPHDPLLDHDRQQAAQELGEPASISNVSAVLDWMTDAISALEADDLNTGGALVLVWLKGKRRELNAQLLALGGDGEKLP